MKFSLLTISHFHRLQPSIMFILSYRQVYLFLYSGILQTFGVIINMLRLSLVSYLCGEYSEGPCARAELLQSLKINGNKNKLKADD